VVGRGFGSVGKVESGYCVRVSGLVGFERLGYHRGVDCGMMGSRWAGQSSEEVVGVEGRIR